MSRTLTAVGATIALLAIVTLGVTAAAPGAGQPRYLDRHASIKNRVNDLLHRMTLEEKVGQMDQIVIGKLRDSTAPANGDCNNAGGNNDPLQTTCLQRTLIDYKTGSILSGGTDNPADNTGKGWAEQYNTIQHYAVEHSRLHIPIIYGVDAVHGFGHPWQAPLFPHSIGIGATWDPAIAEAGGAVTRRALLATGGNWDFAPVQDLARDNRWGRYYETWAEQPALAAALGAANIRGLQGPGGFDSPQVAATVKHFAGYSQSINGHDRVEAQLPIRYLQDVFLPSYAGGIDAGAATVMVDSGSINNVPATSSHFLITEELRHRLGFKGVVISDYGDVPALQTAYHVAADFPTAIAKAVNAGVDVSMTPFDYVGWNAGLIQDVHRGLVSERRIDASVKRILNLKFRLGLFDHPYVDPTAADAAVEAGRDVTLTAARESMTLLRNQGSTLPLAAGARLVVTGPSADSMTNQLGGWSVSWQGVFGAGHVCCMGPPDQIPPGTTVLNGLRAADPNVTYAPDQASAVAAAASADAIVAVVGEKAYAEGLGDDPAPALAPDQKALISALQATGKPVIVVIIAGRPLGLGPAANANALLMAYLPGTEGGTAVADVLFGRVNPSGHLPVSWPSDADQVGGDFCGTCPSPLGDQPKVFDQLPGTNSGQGSGYNPRWPFGFGLSYTTFATSGLSVTGSVSRHGTATATFTVANTGSRAGTTVVPVYVSQPVSTLVVPPRRLVGWAKVTLDPGQSRTVEVTFPASELAVTTGDIDA
ncbi:MAG TPA: glycoside hydrolase family 3 N-terminal domain-containing protein, partial [Gaiellaceae bacterium]|nr:glycoside hydrolase family 3 N-terminal domain-containing protein [Gaiellaceae bacterium]